MSTLAFCISFTQLVSFFDTRSSNDRFDELSQEHICVKAIKTNIDFNSTRISGVFPKLRTTLRLGVVAVFCVPSADN